MIINSASKVQVSLSTNSGAMSIRLIGKMPYLSAHKEKYENESVRIYTYEGSPIIHGHKNINGQRFDVRDGSVSESICYKYEDPPGMTKIVWSQDYHRLPDKIVEGVELIQGEEIPAPPRTDTTLASGDLSCWFNRPRSWQDERQVLRWELHYHGNLVETFVSFEKPLALECMGKIYILVEAWDRGFDVYKLGTRIGEK